MEYLIATVLGAIQGFTEFIPVSSSGHLVLIRQVFDWPDQGLAFDAILHLGTLLAVFIALHKEWKRVFKGLYSFVRTGKLWNSANQKLFTALVVATIPAAASGYFLQSLVEERFRGLTSLGLLFAALGSLYFFVEYAANKRDKTQPSFKDAIWIGLAQVLALLPGVSRSGVTLAAGMLAGIDRQSAASFAFLLSGPIVAGAGLYSLIQLSSDDLARSAIEWGPLIVGALVALIIGWLSIKGMLRFLKKYSLKPFGIYLLGLGGAILLLRVFNIL